MHASTLTRIFIAGLIGAAFFAAYRSSSKAMARSSEPPAIAATKNPYPEGLGLKTTQDDITPGIMPVAIYRVTSTVEHKAAAVGCGTVYRTADGKFHMTTVAKIFTPRPGEAKSTYLISRLRPAEGPSIHIGIAGFEHLKPADYAHGSELDFVYCSIGKPEPVVNFFGDTATQGTLKSFETVAPERMKLELYSVMTGKTHRVIHAEPIDRARQIIRVFMVTDAVADGEGGAGFLDEKGNIYVQSAMISRHGLTPELLRKANLPIDAKFAVLIGPLPRI